MLTSNSALDDSSLGNLSLIEHKFRFITLENYL